MSGDLVDRIQELLVIKASLEDELKAMRELIGVTWRELIEAGMAHTTTARRLKEAWHDSEKYR